MKLTLKQNCTLELARGLRHYSGPGKTRFWKLFQNNLSGEGLLTIQFPEGFQILLDRGEFWQRMMMASCYDRKEFLILQALMEEGENFLDGGAYVGYHTFSIAARISPGKVFAFEPHPKFAAQIRQSCEKNPSLKIEIQSAALSDKNGEALFYLPPENGWQGVEGSLQPVAGWKSIPIQTMTLDSFCNSHSTETFTLAKLDLEGSEPQALRGAQELLKSGRLESVSCEISEKNQKEVFQILSSYSFKKVVHLNSFREASSCTPLRDTRENILWLRGKCYERWQKRGFLKKYFRL